MRYLQWRSTCSSEVDGCYYISAAICKFLNYNLGYLSDNVLSALTSSQLHFTYEVPLLPNAALKSKLYCCALYMNFLRRIMLDLTHSRKHLSFRGPYALAKHTHFLLDLQTSQVIWENSWTAGHLLARRSLVLEQKAVCQPHWNKI